jgi:SAM-dependent methyltransferase
VNRVVADAYPLPNIRSSNASRYVDVPKVDGKETVPCFVATTAEDFSWINGQIALHDYYDRPGIWGYTITAEKRVVADLLACFSPDRVLDLGCANGAIMKCLADLGIHAEGIDLSEAAVDSAFSEIRERIHVGNITEARGLGTFDLVSGLDIFEHVTPSDLVAVIDAVRDVIEENGFLFANIPAFGCDDVFGTVFETYLQQWSESARRGELFDLLHTDDFGFPLHGHLIWAPTDWWVRAFTTRGFTRQPSIERALHERYGEFFRAAAPSRGAFYVFMKGSDAARADAVAAKIRTIERPLPV